MGFMGSGGCAGEVDLFERTREVLSGNQGVRCELSSDLSHGEIIVEHQETCGSGVCLGYEEQSFCSCRCSGEGEGPFCSCGDGYSCENELILGGLSAHSYAGGYCVPQFGRTFTGESCEGEVPGPGQVWVEEAAACFSRVCLGHEGQSFCSCRCSGEGAGPFCLCPSGMHCQDELLVDLQIDVEPQLYGGYCVFD